MITEPSPVGPDAKGDFTYAVTEPSAVAPDAKGDFTYAVTEPSAVAPDPKKLLTIQKLFYFDAASFEDPALPRSVL